MRAPLLAFASLLLLGACGNGVTSNGTAPINGVAPTVKAAPAVSQENMAEPDASPANGAIASVPPEIPGVAEMSPYRRREYERGWRDCRRGAFDRQRQGESYRIGCMAEQEAGERGR